MWDWEDLFLRGMIAVCVILFVVLLVLIVADSTAERFSLKKSDWKCTASHEESTTTVAIIGGGIYPNKSTKTVCDQWSRIQ